jgi:transcriptional regulator with XRE-family HTH domain
MKSNSRRDRQPCRAAQCFGRRLKAWRLRMGLPMSRVARHLDVSTSIVCAWERAERFPNLCHLERIATYTGLPISQLLCERKEPVPDDFPQPRAIMEVDDNGIVLSAGSLPPAADGGLVGSNIFMHVEGGSQARLRLAFRKAKRTDKAVVGSIPFGSISRGAKWLTRVAPVSKNGHTLKFLVIAMDEDSAAMGTMNHGGMSQTLNERMCEMMDRVKSAGFQLSAFRGSMGRALDQRRLAELESIADDLNACWRLLAGMGTREPTPAEVFNAAEHPPGDIPI